MTELTLAPGQAALPEHVAAAPSARGPILIVDPNPALRRIISLILEGEGWPTVALEDAEAAFELLESHAPALVLCDVRPGRPGPLELARRVREASPRPPRIALMSVYPKPGASDADFFLPKPLHFDALLDLLAAIEREDAATVAPGYTR